MKKNRVKLEDHFQRHHIDELYFVLFFDPLSHKSAESCCSTEQAEGAVLSLVFLEVTILWCLNAV